MVGVCLQLLFAGLLCRSARSAWPWLMVLGLELANEWVDLHVEVWPQHAMQWRESAKDVLLTMALPTLLLIVARYRPRLLSGDTSVVAAEPRDQSVSGSPRI